MLRETIIVPNGIRYISEWREFNLPNFPHILDKKIPGCGFTEYCLTNNMNIILCSPRRVLLKNKEDQHKDDILYVKNELDKALGIDKDLMATIPKPSETNQDEVDEARRQQVLAEIEDKVRVYIELRRFRCLPLKLEITYDSFRILKEILIKLGVFDLFYVIVDEFQSIFTDSRFKSSTEMEFLNHLQDIQNLCFVSATPMIDKYLEMLEEFKDLPYFELDWEKECPGRVLKPDLSVKVIKSVVATASEIVQSYKAGEFEVAVDIDQVTGQVREVKSEEAVIYVNSVKNITSIIKKCGLGPDEVNILCANTPENQRRITKALGKKFVIGDVPLKGQPHKMFTFCTRTVYLGADFYSTNARSFILSDANIETLAVDITLDLPQILGRQRLNENPWKNRAELYFKSITSINKHNQSRFDELINSKLDITKQLLDAYSDARASSKHAVAVKYERDAKTVNYKYDYVAVNTHGGKDLYPTINNLVIISEKRAYEIQQIDYKDRFTVFNKLSDGGLVDNNIIKFIEIFNTLPGFYEKMKAICEAPFTDKERLMVLEQVPLTYKNHYLKAGPERLRANGYNLTKINKELAAIEQNSQINISSEIFSAFKIGETYKLQEIKEILKTVYESCNYLVSPKATDLENYFEIRKVQMTNKETGKRDHCLKLIGKK